MDTKETSRSICSKACSRIDQARSLHLQTRCFRTEVAKECTLQAIRLGAHPTAPRPHRRLDLMPRQARRSSSHFQRQSQSRPLRVRGRRRMLRSCTLLSGRSTTQCFITNISPHVLHVNLLPQLHIRVRLTECNNLPPTKTLLLRRLNTISLRAALLLTLPSRHHHRLPSNHTQRQAIHNHTSRSIKHIRSRMHSFNTKRTSLCTPTSSTFKSRRHIHQFKLLSR